MAYVDYNRKAEKMKSVYLNLVKKNNQNKKQFNENDLKNYFMSRK